LTCICRSVHISVYRCTNGNKDSPLACIPLRSVKAPLVRRRPPAFAVDYVHTCTALARHARRSRRTRSTSVRRKSGAVLRQNSVTGTNARLYTTVYSWECRVECLSIFCQVRSLLSAVSLLKLTCIPGARLRTGLRIWQTRNDRRLLSPIYTRDMLYM
jgi:hypothetical protein